MFLHHLLISWILHFLIMLPLVLLSNLPIQICLNSLLPILLHVELLFRLFVMKNLIKLSKLRPLVILINRKCWLNWVTSLTHNLITSFAKRSPWLRFTKLRGTWHLGARHRSNRYGVKHFSLIVLFRLCLVSLLIRRSISNPLIQHL